MPDPSRGVAAGLSLSRTRFMPLAVPPSIVLVGAKDKVLAPVLGSAGVGAFAAPNTDRGAAASVGVSAAVPKRPAFARANRMLPSGTALLGAGVSACACTAAGAGERAKGAGAARVNGVKLGAPPRSGRGVAAGALLGGCSVYGA